jgi:GNAT superfamily N-acetyltransferase
MRTLAVEDEPILWPMLQVAAHESSLEAVRHQPCLARYVTGWGRAGDLGWVAEIDHTAIGAAWVRLWSGSDQGFGCIDAATPELAIAVLPPYQGQGIGTQLLKQVLASSKKTGAAVSLSVRSDNPAVRLYERLGFVRVDGSAIVNRTGGTSFNMLCHLQRA